MSSAPASRSVLPGVSLVHRLISLVFTLLTLFVFVDPVAADAGDVIGGLLGAALALVVVCAFLGWWSRRNGGGSAGSGSTSTTDS